MSSDDLLIHNGTIITMDEALSIIPNGAVAIQKDTIVRVGPLEAVNPTLKADTLINAQGGLVLPGLINSHTHLPMSVFRGLADDLPLSIWLNEHIFPAEAQHVNPELVRVGTQLACAEMILSGTTCLCDGYFHETTVAETVEKIGLRGVLGQGVIDFPAPGVPDPKYNIQRAQSFADRWRQKCSRITPAIFCHSPYTCSGETLTKAKEAASERGLLFLIHLAETKTEWKQIQADHQKTPVQYLHSLGILDATTLLIHAVWVDDEDIAILRKKDTAISHNPESNMKLAAGIARVPEFIEAGIRVGLGTDGCASNNDLDLFSEMDTAAKLHKVHTMDPTRMDALTTFKMVTSIGAQVLGLDSQIGSLAPGKKADMIILSRDVPHLTPLYHPYSHLVYAAKGADVKDVIVDGKILLKDRVLQTLDLTAVLTEARRLGQIIAG